MKKLLFGNRLMSLVWTLIIVFGVALVLNYFFLVPINLHYSGFWLFAAVMTLWGIGVGCLFDCKVNKIRKDEVPDTYGENFGYVLKVKFKYYPIMMMSIIIIVTITLLGIILSISGSKMFNALSYRNIISIEEGNFADEIIEIDSKDIVTVDVTTARKVGDRQAGKFANPSWFEVDNEYNLISYNGEEYRISPMEYAGLTKEWKAKGIPGYVLVNAKTQSSEAVTLEQPMVYSPSAHFSKDLSRHLRNNYPTYMFGKTFFEIDDEGNPFWITAVNSTTIGMFGGVCQDSAILTNAVTGECTEHAINDLPDWVDHVHSVSYLMERVRWYYRYSEGFINFSNTNVYKTAYSYRDERDNEGEETAADEYTPFDGYNTVLSKDGEILFYTGITPANRAETNIGFVLISPRTGKAKFYPAEGAEESSAQLSAEGLVQNLKYSASFPTIVNVDGVETYFMTLKDGAGLIKKYALCNVGNYANCVEADSIDETIEKYKIKIGLIDGVIEEESGNTVENEPEKAEENYELIELSGIIGEVKEAQLEGYTYYYFTLDTMPEMVFMSSIENSNMQPMKLVKDATITVSYYKSNNETGIGIVKALKFN